MLGGTVISSLNTGWLPWAQPDSLIFGRCSRCRKNCLLNACLAWKVSLLLVCIPRQQALQGRGLQEHLNGILLSILRAAAPASQALILLLWEGAGGGGEACGWPAELSPSRRGLPSLPRALSPGGWRPCLAFCLPSMRVRAHARVLSCRACLLWGGEESQVTSSEEGEDTTWRS